MPTETIGGVSLHYIHSPAPPGAPSIIFIHGAGGDHTVWGSQFAALRGQAGTVAIDLPGHGRSARGGELSIPGYALAVSSLSDYLGLRRPFLAGSSMGGAVALQLGLDSPGFPSGIVLVGSGAKLGVSPRIIELVERDPEAAVRAIAVYAYAEGTPAEEVRQAELHLLNCPPDVLLADYRACAAFDQRGRIGELRTPVLVICGTGDRLVFPKTAEWLTAALPHSRLVLIEGAGHLAMIDRPGEVSAAIRSFVERPLEQE